MSALVLTSRATDLRCIIGPINVLLVSNHPFDTNRLNVSVLVHKSVGSHDVSHELNAHSSPFNHTDVTISMNI